MNPQPRKLLPTALLALSAVVVISLRLAPPTTPHFRHAALDAWVVPLAAWIFFYCLLRITWNFRRKSVLIPTTILAVLWLLPTLFISVAALIETSASHGGRNSNHELLGEVHITGNSNLRLYYFNNGPLVSDTLCLRRERDIGVLVFRESVWWADDGQNSARLKQLASDQIAVVDGAQVLYVFRPGA
jgi:hypothetical protein